MMSTSSNGDVDGHMSLMNHYSSLPSPLSYLEYDHSILYYHEQSLRAGKGIIDQPPRSNDEPFSTAPNNIDVSEGDMNAILDQENEKSEHGSIKKISRRSYKGDRHSKISTAQGLRDRRMRLSLDVARQFFKLQDMLNYDKPSKTVKWLLLQAKSAIKNLKETSGSSSTNGTKTTTSASPASEVEVGESVNNEDIENGKLRASTSKGKSKQMRKNSFNLAAKELRKKARERARVRTQKKEQAKVMNLDQGHVRYKGTLELEEVSGTESRNMTSSSHGYFEIEQPIQDERNPLGTRDEFSRTYLTDWSPRMSLSYHQQNQETCQLYSIPEFDQFHGSSWEAYSAPDLCQYWNSP